MGYASLRACVEDLHKHGLLRYIDFPVDPHLEMAFIQRKAFESQAPALLFTKPKNTKFPMLANLFGAKERINFIFRDTLPRVKSLFEARADFTLLFRRPAKAFSLLPSMLAMRPKYLTSPAPVLAQQCELTDLPQLVSWPQDGGAFITLPLVYTQNPAQTGKDNLGMYRVQLGGNDYCADEVGLHYQLQRGIGVHHEKALGVQQRLPVNVSVGGPPSLTIAAVMPLPEGMSELIFAGLLGGRRVELAKTDTIPVLAQCDFVLQGYLDDLTKPEGPFGDHLGYYSLKHDFPVMKVRSVHHRKDAIWPFTSVGRPPQEDTMFGELIHELTAPLVNNVFPGIKEIHAVDAAGVHPLLLAIGSERYTPWDAVKKPKELLTLAMHLLGTTQTALSKYILITSPEAGQNLSCRDISEFLRHMLMRTDFHRDLHFFTASACDTLDYSGYALNEGSRLIWATYGASKRSLASELHDLPFLPEGYGNPEIVMPGILALGAPQARYGRKEADPDIEYLLQCLETWPQKESFPFIVIVDDPVFCARSIENFLWITFTRTDPARDSYGANATISAKHWGCDPPFILDARLKPFHAQPLEDDPKVVARVEQLAASGGPLAGLF